MFLPARFNPKLLTKSIVLSSCLLTDHALASTAVAFPAAPGLSVTALTGDVGTGYVDAMVPFIGQPTAFFYIDPQGVFHSRDDYSLALGLGARKLTEKAGILGAYVFGDYNHAPDGRGFWFVSPGVERLGERVDLSANLYIPVGSSQTNTGTYFGSQIGIYDGVSFAGHTQFDQLYNTYESVGIGGDAQISYRLPVKNNSKLQLGGYHFNPKNADSITGGAVRLEIPFSEQLSINLSNGYDNLAQNTFKIGFTYNFGDRRTPMNFKGDLAERMVDATQRNLIAVAGNAKTAQPIINSTVATGQNVVVMDNISFFLPNPISTNGSAPDGTYENPYIGLTQDNVDSANSSGNTNLFFNGGSGITYSSDNAINLANNNIYGRQSYQGRLFVQPASGDNRPLLDFPNSSGLIWDIVSGDSNILVTSIKLTSNNYNNNLEVNNHGAGEVSLNIDNVDASGGITGAAFGIYAKNLGAGVLNLIINNSRFNNNFVGLYAENSSSDSNGTLNIITNNSTFNNNGGDGLLVYNFNAGILSILTNNSTFNNNGQNGAAVVNFDGTANVTSNNSTFNNNEARGFEFARNDSGTVNMTANNSTFNNNEMDGLWTFNGSGVFTIMTNSSIFNGNGNDGLYAKSLGGSLYLTANNSGFNDNGNYGIQTENATAVINNNSTFSGNGSGDINPPITDF